MYGEDRFFRSWKSKESISSKDLFDFQDHSEVLKSVQKYQLVIDFSKINSTIEKKYLVN